MKRDLLVGLLALSPLFGLFGLFLAAIYLRSRYNKTHPEAARTPAERLRGRVIGGTIYGVLLVGVAYAILQENRFASSWSITFYVGLAAFVVGEAIGRRNAMRRIEGKSAQDETLIVL